MIAAMNAKKTPKPGLPASVPLAWTIVLFGLLCPSVALAHDPAGWARSVQTGQIVALLVIIIAPFFFKIPFVFRGIIIVISVGGALTAWFGLLPVLAPLLDTIMEPLLDLVERLFGEYGAFFAAGFLPPIVFLLLVTGLVVLLRVVYKKKIQKKKNAPT